MTGEPLSGSDGAWSPVADGPEEFTAAWLSRALGREVSAVAAERIGTGQTGATYRLSFDSAEGPRTLIAKVAAGDASERRRVRNGYRSEVGFYRAHRVDRSTSRPRGAGTAAITDDSLAFTLLLDDLAAARRGCASGGVHDRAGRASP